MFMCYGRKITARRKKYCEALLVVKEDEEEWTKNMHVGRIT